MLRSTQPSSRVHLDPGTNNRVRLLTPKSIESDWVMCEAGACWVLEKPIIPAVLYVDVKTLRELMFSPGAAALHAERSSSWSRLPSRAR